MLRTKSATGALQVLQAHGDDLANLHLPLVSHNSVSESQALKDANRDVLCINGVAQPSGAAPAILGTIVALVRLVAGGCGCACLVAAWVVGVV